LVLCFSFWKVLNFPKANGVKMKNPAFFGGGAYMLSIFYQIKTHPPCSAGIIMTITTVIIVITELTLFDLLFNMDDLLEQKYSHHLKKQRTICNYFIK